MSRYKRHPRQGEYARRILSDTPGTDLGSSGSELSDPYLTPVNAFEAGIRTLYKYRPLGDMSIRPDGTTATQGVVQLLTEQKLYAATPQELNDVFEITLRPGEASRDDHIRFLKLTLEGRNDLQCEVPELVALTSGFEANSLHLIHDTLLRILEAEWREVRIISLSATCNENLMWAHYAGSHTGVCLGFRVRSGTMFGEALQVVYHETAPVYTLGRARIEEMQETATLAKHMRWSHEDEWRVIVTHLDPSKIWKLLPFERADVAEIIFGLRISKDAEKTVRTTARRFPHVRFGRTMITENQLLDVAWES